MGRSPLQTLVQDHLPPPLQLGGSTLSVVVETPHFFCLNPKTGAGGTVG